MKRTSLWSTAFPLALSVFLPITAQTAPLNPLPFPAATSTTPKPGSPLRKKILDALRIPVTKFNDGQRITFTNVDLRVQNSTLR